MMQFEEWGRSIIEAMAVEFAQCHDPKKIKDTLEEYRQIWVLEMCEQLNRAERARSFGLRLNRLNEP